MKKLSWHTNTSDINSQSGKYNKQAKTRQHKERGGKNETGKALSLDIQNDYGQKILHF